MDNLFFANLNELLNSFEKASERERAQFLAALVSVCRPCDLLVLHKQLSKSSLRVDFIAKLPEELAILILTNLSSDPWSLVCASRVSRRWHRLIQDSDLWRRLCFNNGWSITSRQASNTPSQLTSFLRASSSSRSLLSPIPRSPSFFALRAPWKTLFVDRYLTHQNWYSGRYQVVPVTPRRRTIANGENRSVSLWLSFDEALSSAVSVSPTEPVAQLWQVQTGQLQSQLHGHEGIISAVKIDQNKVVSGGVDRTLRIWDSKTGELLKTLVGHEGEIECLQFDKHLIVTGSSDKTVRVWDMHSGECLWILRGHNDAVTCILLKRNRIISGSCDGSLRIWSIETGECLNILASHGGNVLCIDSHEDILVSGSADRTIKTWNITTGQLRKTLTGHNADVICLQCDSNKIVSGSADQSIKVWSLHSGALLHTMHQHNGPVWNLRFKNSKLYSASLDQSILMWDFSGLNHLSREVKKKWGLDESVPKSADWV